MSDISMYSNNRSTQSETSQEGMYILRLIESKFKALERLVFVLKKTVLMFESNDDLCERFLPLAQPHLRDQ